MPQSVITRDFLKKVSNSYRGLGSETIVREADRPISVALVGGSAAELRQMEEFFVPKQLSRRKAGQVRERLCFFVRPLRDLELQGLQHLDLVICSPSGVSQVQPFPHKVYSWPGEDPHAMVRAVLNRRDRSAAAPAVVRFHF